MSAIPRDAASVILMRPAGSAVQALLIRRHANLAFAGGTLVFPGGKLEPADEAAATDRAIVLADRIPAADPEAPADPRARAKTLALIVAACRETFEETGIMLAHRRDGADCGANLALALQELRPGVSRDPAAFSALLAGHGLVIDPARLIPWSHWITPSLAPKRFDTRFFVAMMPPEQNARCDSAEATEILWLDLGTADDLPDATLMLAPPTRISLGELCAALRWAGDAQRLMQLEAHRDVVPIMPKLSRSGGEVTAVLPWDAEYGAMPGDGIPIDPRHLERYRAFPSRLGSGGPVSGLPPLAG